MLQCLGDWLFYKKQSYLKLKNEPTVGNKSCLRDSVSFLFMSHEDQFTRLKRLEDLQTIIVETLNKFHMSKL